MKSLKQRIELVKEVTGWSNAELARQAGTSRTAPTDWLSGDVATLSSTVAQRLSSKTKFSAVWLATGDGEPYRDAKVEDVSTRAHWPFSGVSPEDYALLSVADKEDIEALALVKTTRAKRRRPHKEISTTKITEVIKGGLDGLLSSEEVHERAKRQRIATVDDGTSKNNKPD